ncbi:FMN-binding protein [Blautia sp. MSJ-19]|uniref:FMN-binding protein n=1 Tax=Blautia sp. MSJ-19 TaxID=2841517 RepID=UPI001C0E9213|nr:Ig-like domain-containing protein [Blautia sp. MSJ-19]MBU5482007.1 Ig-like domain-containing protein [Blautia sp. MSJ-19]
MNFKQLASIFLTSAVIAGNMPLTAFADAANVEFESETETADSEITSDDVTDSFASNTFSSYDISEETDDFSSGATLFSSDAPSDQTDDTYISTQSGLVQRFMYYISVDCSMKNGKILSAAYSKDSTIGDQNIAYAETAMEGIQEQISSRGGISSVQEIDTVSGATLSSNGIKQALANALGESFDLTAANGSLVQGKNGELGIDDSVKKAANFLNFNKDADGNIILPTQEEVDSKSEAWKTLYSLYLQAVDMSAAKAADPSSVNATEEGLLISRIDEAIVKVKEESGNNGGGHNGGEEGKPADTSALQALIDQVKALDSSSYTPESWKTVQDELAEAEQLLTMKRLKQSAVDTMQADLQAAVDALVKTQVEQSISVRKTSYSVAYGTSSFSLNAKANTSLTYQSDAPSVVTVNANGIVTVTGIGTAKITIKATETAAYKGASRTVSITVRKGTQKFTGVSSSYTKAIGSKAFSLNAKAPGKITYKSSNSSIVSVSQTGKVTVKKVGTAKITLTAAATSKYNKTTKTVTIKVTKKVPSIKVKTTSKSVKKATVKKKSQSFSLNASVNSKGKLSYQKLSGSKQLTVNKTTGKITVKKGTAKGTYKAVVKVNVSAKGQYGASSKTVTITVKVK